MNNDRSIPTPTSKTGATITLVTSNTRSSVLCEPDEECRPMCEECTPPCCSPDCTCEPDCEEAGMEYNADPDPYPLDNDQDCEPNT